MVTNNGRCGLCGDPFNGERVNETGEKYALGIISRFVYLEQCTSELHALRQH